MYGSFEFGLHVCISVGLDNVYNVVAISVNVTKFTATLTNIPTDFFTLILGVITKPCSLQPIRWLKLTL